MPLCPPIAEVFHLFTSRRMSKINFLPASLLSFIIASFFIHPDISAQPWIAPTEDGANFFDIQRSFNEYWEGKRLNEAKVTRFSNDGNISGNIA